MLGGEYRHVIDSKNRLFIPATHRKELGENIAIVRNTHGKYLSVYSEADWEAYCAKIKEKLPTEEKEIVLRYYNRNAVFTQPDSQGRVVLPSALLDHIGITKDGRDAVIVGCGDYAEIWAATVYDKDTEDEESINAILKAYGL